MQIDTLRFGVLEVDENKALHFANGLPGLEDCFRFAVLQFEESSPLHWMQSIDKPEICLPIINSFSIFKDYAFDISDEDVDELELKSPDDLYVVSVVVIPEQHIEQMTANMIAPIIINHRTGKAKQIIIGNGEYNARQPIFQAVLNLLKEDDADAGTVSQDQ